MSNTPVNNNTDPVLNKANSWSDRYDTFDANGATPITANPLSTIGVDPNLMEAMGASVLDPMPASATDGSSGGGPMDLYSMFSGGANSLNKTDSMDPTDPTSIMYDPNLANGTQQI